MGGCSMVIHLVDELEHAEGGESPQSPGEVRCKMTGSGQTQGDIDAQLRANMLLLTCHSFYKKVMNTPPSSIESCLDEVKKLSCYGVTFGRTTMIVIYKLQLDFRTNCCTYTERFRSPDCPVYGSLINSSLAYVLDRVGKWKEKEEEEH